jgi:glycosyltransferase involved in cell wall biosynthesis
MKNILFVINNLNCGGAEKALISLLETIDYSKYRVDLYMFKHEGLFLSKVPHQVNLLEEPIEYKYFDMSIKTAIFDCLKMGYFKIIPLRIIAGLIFRVEKNRARCEQRVWKYLSKSLVGINKKYDIAVGYLEKNPIFFCVDKVNATKKIGFIHNDYNMLGMDPAIDIKYFDKLDNIVTVSEECSNVLKGSFPKYINKIEVMYNIVSPNMINKLSLEEVKLNNNSCKIVSVGRLNYQKGFDLAIESCFYLVNKGYNVRWYVIGEGEERKKLEEMIRERNLQDNFFLLGIKENPYPYIRASDIYVQTSRFEGKSIAIDEAKILNKPIVVTNFSTAKDQIKNEQNGLIVDMNASSIVEGIRRLLENKSLRNKLQENLINEELGTESEIIKLYKLFDVV